MIADSGQTILVAGNHSLPPGSVHRQLLRESRHGSPCPWKGEAQCCDIVVDGREDKNAA